MEWYEPWVWVLKLVGFSHGYLVSKLDANLFIDEGVMVGNVSCFDVDWSETSNSNCGRWKDENKRSKKIIWLNRRQRKHELTVTDPHQLFVASVRNDTIAGITIDLVPNMFLVTSSTSLKVNCRSFWSIFFIDYLRKYKKHKVSIQKNGIVHYSLHDGQNISIVFSSALSSLFNSKV